MIRLSEIVLLSSQKILKLTALKTKLFILSLFVSANCLAQRTETYISEWQFSRDSMSWETVTVPHDWAISGPFDKKWDLQKVAITQNGETEATEKSGRSGALPWIGEGMVSHRGDDSRRLRTCRTALRRGNVGAAGVHQRQGGRLLGIRL